MSDKQILVETTLHNQVKAAAAIRGQKIRDFAEDALRAWLKANPIQNKEEVISDD